MHCDTTQNIYGNSAILGKSSIEKGLNYAVTKEERGL